MRVAAIIAGLAAVAGLALGAAWILSTPDMTFSATEADTLTAAGDIEHGRLLFNAADCSSCHVSPGQKDYLRLGGGMALASPYGIFRPPNISSDETDGIGKWSQIDIARALLKGVSPDGQHYFPAFPYTSYTHMRLEDVRDLASYLKTVPAVAGKPPPHELSFPLNIRRTLGLWKLMFFDQGPLADAPNQSTAWNRGRYLVEAVAHCSECHSSRNSFGAIRKNTEFAGAVDPTGTGFIPNITPTGIGSWSVDDIAEMLRSGRTPQGRQVGSSMADVVRNTATLSNEDRHAIATFIKSLPARPTPQP